MYEVIINLAFWQMKSLTVLHFRWAQDLYQINLVASLLIKKKKIV